MKPVIDPAELDRKGAQSAERADAAQKEAFARYLDQPLVKLVLSTIPAGNDPDTLRHLLSDTFRAGFNNGAGYIVSDFTNRVVGPMIMQRRKSDPDKGLN